MAGSADFIWMNGKVIPWQDAKIHVSAEGLLRGANVFEGMRAYWNDAERELYIFRNAEHLKRFRQSMWIMRLSVPYDDAAFTAAFISLFRANKFAEGVHFRPVAYFGVGEAHAWEPEQIETGAFVLAYTRPPAASLKGIRSCVSTWRRNSDNASPSRVKAAANYHNARLAQVEAKMNGFGPPIMLNDQGEVSESPGACFMMVRDGKVITPPVSADILEGITRESLIELYRAELGVEVIERDIDRSELYIADEAFFCGSGAEVQPIVEIDHYKVGDGKPGPLTRKIMDLYFDIAKGKVAKYRHWLTPVYGAKLAK
jgi:branched-chain amino acid aminotransferase